MKVTLGEPTTSSIHPRPITLVLCDADPSARSTWRKLVDCMATELRLSEHDCYPCSMKQEPGIVIIDRSTCSGNFARQVSEFCQQNRGQQLVVTGCRLTVDAAVDLMRAGAAMVYEKPLDMERMRGTIAAVIHQARETRSSQQEFIALENLFGSLTPRERQVLTLVLDGVHNRCSAEQLGVSVRTIEARRSKVYSKLECNGLAELVRKRERLEQLRTFFAAWPRTDSESSPLGRPHLNCSQRTSTSTGHL